MAASTQRTRARAAERKRPRPAQSAAVRRTAVKRGGAVRKRKRSRRNAQRSLSGALRALPGFAGGSRTLTPVQRELLGWSLCAFGLFSCFVIYAGWDGGGVGRGIVWLLGYLAGRARLLMPAALVAGGVALLLRPALAERAGEALRPLRGAIGSAYAAVTLALAAGSFGLSPGQSPSAVTKSHFEAGYVQARGGIVGQGLWWLINGLTRQIGVDVAIAFLLIVSFTLFSGASVKTIGRSLRAVGRLARASFAWLLAPVPAIAPQRPPSVAEDPWRPAGPGGERLGLNAAEDALAGWPFEDARSITARDTRPPERREERAQETAGGSWEEVDDAPGDASGPVEAAEAIDAGAIEPQRPSAASGAAEASLDGSDGDEAVDGGGEAGAGDPRARDEQDRAMLTPQGRLRAAVTDDPCFQWTLPAAERLLQRSGGQANAEADRAQADGRARTGTVLVEALGHFGVQAKVIGTVSGPHITRYELRLAPGIKVAKVAQLKDDLAYALAATDIRILAPIPGKQAVGVEVPNAKRRMVRLGDVFGAAPSGSSPLTVWLGKDVAGKAISADLAKMPHLLVAGATGSGKSGAINAMLTSLLLRADPHEMRLVLVDPKQVELNHYESIPHLLTPVITNPRMAANALANLVREMEQRYSVMSLARARNLEELNSARGKRGEAPLPYILCVIDELADLMMVAPADVEDSIIRLAQKARAVGIHLVLATQSPRVDVITGMIKANVPSRIAFAVSSQTDSRVILDQNGAESLLGQGDMLFSPMGSSKLQRIQGAFIDEAQIARITGHWRKQGEPELREELLAEVEGEDAAGAGEDPSDPDQDPLLGDAIVLVAEMQTASTSMMQRRLRVGYTRAGRLIDMLERRGIISGYEGSKPRQVLIGESELPRLLGSIAPVASQEPSEQLELPAADPLQPEQLKAEQPAGT